MGLLLCQFFKYLFNQQVKKPPQAFVLIEKDAIQIFATLVKTHPVTIKSCIGVKRIDANLQKNISRIKSA
jgi:hypothetical protein